MRMPSLRLLAPHFSVAVAFSSAFVAGGAAQAQTAPSAADVCQRWTADRADLSEGTSTADVTTCAVGTWGAPGPANSLKLVNLYRFIAAMPAVTEDPSFDAFAQSCALLQAANSSTGLSHTPDAAAACFSTMAQTGSMHSSICGGQGVECIDLYMSDKGSAELGHRRWVFANYLGPVGFGSVGTGGRSATGSCFYQPAGSTNAHFPFVAWPPGGSVPVQAITTTQADSAGWSVQSDTINLNSATATVMDGTASMPVTVAALPANFGSTYAIRILPMGWTSEAGHSYAVTLGGTSSAVGYTVDVVDCANFDGGAEGTDAGSSSGSGGSGGSSGSGGPGDAAAPGDGGNRTGSRSDAGGPGGGAITDATVDLDGASDSASSPPSASRGGCSCDSAGPRADSGLAGAAVLAATGIAVRRRRARRRGGLPSGA
jgi:MYXO-CTERM domain-containing protein